MITLYSFWRSSASYRVRIALNLKGVDYRIVPINLLRDGGQQLGAEYRNINPQQRVPYLVDGDVRLAQSHAIIDYLDARYPQPSLIPAEPGPRAAVLAFAQAIIADIQPLQNTGTLNYLRDELKIDDEARAAWLRHFITRGLTALETEVAARPATPFAFGDAPTIADCALVPQMFAAQRFGCELARFPRLAAIAAHCDELPAFLRSQPSQQPDAGTTA